MPRLLTIAILATLFLGLTAVRAADGITSIHLVYIGDLSDGTGDYDGDGLTDWQEVKLTHTDPRHVDSDGDGWWDGQELRAGTNPLRADTDGDGCPDGWTPALLAAHRLFNPQPGDRTVTIRLTRPTPADNHAVLLVGDLPLMLCETNSWTFSIPTGTVWNVELKVGERRWCGTRVHLELEGGEGVFAENADEIFASVRLEEVRSVTFHAGPAEPPPPTGGSRGGSAKLYAPCIFLDPVSQVVHCDESAEVRVRCVPDTPPLAGKLLWSFNPDYASAYVDVAQDTLSATVSGLGPDSPPTITLHADVGYALTSGATINYCHGHDNCPTNHVYFPPNHTNVTINPVFRDCEHPFGDDPDDPDVPKIFLEVEVGRDTATGWQHLAWVDTDSETPGIQQRTAISRDNPPTINWNAKATSAAPLANGLDSLVYDDLTTFTRAFPAVAAGQYVPPPFATITSRTFDDKDNLISEFSSTLAIPQYVQITWNSAVIEEFRQPIVFDYPGASTLAPTNVTIFTGCTAAEATAAFDGIAAKVQAMFPSEANIVVVGPDADVPQPHKTIVIQSGRYTNPVTGGYSSDLGRTPNEHCHQRNDSAWGTAYVYVGTIRGSLPERYEEFYLSGETFYNFKNDWKRVPLPLSASLLADYIALVSLHESGHSMGLVPTASAKYDGHNDCICGGHFMDDGSFRWPPVYLGFIRSLVQFWKPENRSYLEFVFPLTP